MIAAVPANIPVAVKKIRRHRRRTKTSVCTSPQTISLLLSSTSQMRNGNDFDMGEKVNAEYQLLFSPV